MIDIATQNIASPPKKIKKGEIQKTPKSFQKPERLLKLQEAPSVTKTMDFSTIEATPKIMKKCKARRVVPSSEPQLNEKINEIWSASKGGLYMNKIKVTKEYKKSKFNIKSEEEPKISLMESSPQAPKEFEGAENNLENSNEENKEMENMNIDQKMSYVQKHGTIPQIICKYFMNRFISDFNLSNSNIYMLFSNKATIDYSEKNITVSEWINVKIMQVLTENFISFEKDDDCLRVWDNCDSFEATTTVKGIKQNGKSCIVEIKLDISEVPGEENTILDPENEEVISKKFKIVKAGISI